MAITIPTTANDSAWTSTQSSVTALTATTPTNAAIGDVLVAIVINQQTFSTASSPYAFTAPSGWVAAAPSPTDTTERASSAFVLVVSSTPASSYTFSWPGTAGRMGVLIFRVTGVDQTNPIDSLGSGYSSSATTSSAVVPATTIVNANSLAIAAIHATGTSAQSWPTWGTPPSGWTTLSTNNTSPTTGSASNDGIWVGYELFAATGSTGSMTETMNTQTAVSGFMFALKAAASSTAVSRFIAATPMYVAHRGGDADNVQDTAYAYAQAAAWNTAMALEVSVVRTSDGYYMLSDSLTTGANYTTNLTIGSSTKAQLAVLRTISGNYAPMFLDSDILPLYAGNRVIFLDCKNASSQAAGELRAITDANGGAAWWIYKGSYNNVAWYTQATSGGYKSWGYWFPSDTAGGNLNSTTAANWTILGIEYDDTTAIWTQAVSYGKPVIGHIIANTTQAGTAISQGATGLMVSGVRAVVPTNAVSYTVGLYFYNSSGSLISASPSMLEEVYTYQGALTVKTGTARIYNNIGRTLAFSKISANVGTAPVGSSLILDVRKNGTTIYTTAANRPTIVAGANVSTLGTPDVSTWEAGSYLTVDIDQVGSITNGSDLTVQIIAI